MHPYVCFYKALAAVVLTSETSSKTNRSSLGSLHILATFLALFYMHQGCMLLPRSYADKVWVLLPPQGCGTSCSSQWNASSYRITVQSSHTAWQSSRTAWPWHIIVVMWCGCLCSKDSYYSPMWIPLQVHWDILFIISSASFVYIAFYDALSAQFDDGCFKVHCLYRIFW